MKVSEICIKRPVLAVVISLLMIVFGAMGYHYLTTRFFPQTESPIILVDTTYPGASPELIETSITTPLEEAVSGISGIDTISSQSAQSDSLITINLKYGVDSHEVANEIRDKVSAARGRLPDEADAPVIQVGWGSMELMDIAFQAPSLPKNALRDYLERYVVNKISEISGVADAEVFGANKFAMRIWLNPNAMAAHKVSVTDVENAINNNNIELPAGTVKESSFEIPITAETKLQNAQQFQNIVVKNDHGHLIYLKNIAKVALGSDNSAQTIVKEDGKPAVILQIHNSNDANPIQVAHDVQQALHDIKNQLPSDMTMKVFFNQADFMNSSVHEVYRSIFMAICCVVMVVFLFLGQWRTVLIPIATIPVCLIASFGFMYLFGFSINVITLLALVLSIGLVVDDAIVMLENIYRYIEQGMQPFKAAIHGSKEISFAVIAMTLTLCAVYAPIGLIQGQGAIIFRSFAFTLAIAVLISGFIALTLSPMMCSKLLTNKLPNRYTHYLDRRFHQLELFYKKILTKVLNHRRWFVMVALLIATSGYFLFGALSKEFSPHEDLGFIITTINTPSGSNIHYIDNKLQQITSIINSNTNVDHSVSFVNENSLTGFDSIFTTLKPYNQRQQSAQQIADTINHQIANIPGLDARTFPPYFGGSGMAQLQFVLMSSGSYRDLYQTTKNLIGKLQNYPGIAKLTSNLNFDNAEYQLHINRPLANQMGIDAKTIDQTVAALFGGQQITRFTYGGQDYDVYLQANPRVLSNIDQIKDFYITNAQGQNVPLANLVSIQSVLSQQILPHYERLRSADMYAQLGNDYSLGTVVSYLESTLPSLLPNDTKFAFTGMAKNLQESNGNMGIIFLLAIVFIYLVLSAQFESFIDPLIVLLVVPLCIVGAMLTLKIFGGSLNIYTDIGLVTLIGLIAKHGILITQFANQLQAQGQDRFSAVITAASIRLRPILMTTAAMIFGALPLILASGANAASRQQIGMVIIGGLFFGTFFSLILVPIAYTYCQKLKRKTRDHSITEQTA